MKHLYWIGPRESDMFYTGDLFNGSVTYFGSNQNGNKAFCSENNIRVEHNSENENVSNFILMWQFDKIKKYPDCKFMSYNPNCIIGAPNEIKKHSICINDENLMLKLNNKSGFRQISENVIPLIKIKNLNGEEINLSNLKKIYNSRNEVYVIQKPVSSGGHGTFLLNSENENIILPQLEKNETYIVSEYIEENIPINIHAMIYDNDIILLPGSVQIIRTVNDKLLYRGADYITYMDIRKNIIDEFQKLSYSFSKKIQKMGYRGIIGIDAIISKNEIYFLESNNRFQGSSFVLNKVLMQNRLPSLQQMHYDAFYNSYDHSNNKEKIEKLFVPHSFYSYINEDGGKHSEHIFNAAKKESDVSEIISDGYNPEQETEQLAYQFALLFKTNIVSIGKNSCPLNIFPNICVTDDKWSEQIKECDLSKLKISLINRGAAISPEAARYIETHGQLRKGTYLSLDIYISGIYINCPLYVKFAHLSPFVIDTEVSGNGLCIKYYGIRISGIDYDRKTTFPVDKLKNGAPIEQISFLATDRLRLQNSSYCTFPRHGVECAFCEAKGINNNFGKEEILEAIDIIFHEKRVPFRHILIGGLSNEIGKEKDTILSMCQKIRTYTDMPIYLMCLPPLPEDIEEYYSIGVSEFGFNIEVYDRKLAKEYMPGKGNIPIEKYFKAFDKAVSLVGNKGAVRCAFILGLEPKNSLLKGIRKICEHGVAPILSVFRPIPGTRLENFSPPTDEWLYDIMYEAEKISSEYGLSLGPQCPACRNNTLTFVQSGEVEKLFTSKWKRERNEI